MAHGTSSTRHRASRLLGASLFLCLLAIGISQFGQGIFPRQAIVIGPIGIGDPASTLPCSSRTFLRVRGGIEWAGPTESGYQGVFQTAPLNLGLRLEVADDGTVALISSHADDGSIAVLTSTINLRANRDYKFEATAHSSGLMRLRLGGVETEADFGPLRISCNETKVGVGYDSTRRFNGNADVTFYAEGRGLASFATWVFRLLLIGAMLLAFRALFFFRALLDTPRVLARTLRLAAFTGLLGLLTFLSMSLVDFQSTSCKRTSFQHTSDNQIGLGHDCKLKSLSLVFSPVQLSQSTQTTLVRLLDADRNAVGLFRRTGSVLTFESDVSNSRAISIRPFRHRFQLVDLRSIEGPSPLTVRLRPTSIDVLSQNRTIFLETFKPFVFEFVRSHYVDSLSGTSYEDPLVLQTSTSGEQLRPAAFWRLVFLLSMTVVFASVLIGLWLIGFLKRNRSWSRRRITSMIGICSIAILTLPNPQMVDDTKTGFFQGSIGEGPASPALNTLRPIGRNWQFDLNLQLEATQESSLVIRSSGGFSNGDDARINPPFAHVFTQGVGSKQRAIVDLGVDADMFGGLPRRIDIPIQINSGSYELNLSIVDGRKLLISVNNKPQFVYTYSKEIVMLDRFLGVATEGTNWRTGTTTASVEGVFQLTTFDRNGSAPTRLFRLMKYVSWLSLIAIAVVWTSNQRKRRNVSHLDDKTFSPLLGGVFVSFAIAITTWVLASWDGNPISYFSDFGFGFSPFIRFSDLHEVSGIAGSDSPYELMKSNYPPGALAITRLLGDQTIGVLLVFSLIGTLALIRALLPSRDGRGAKHFLLVLLSCAYPLGFGLERGSTEVITLFLVLLSLFLSEQGKYRTAAVILGLAIAWKVTPIFFLLSIFGLNRRFRLLLLSIFSALTFSIVGALVLPERGIAEIAGFLRSILNQQNSFNGSLQARNASPEAWIVHLRHFFSGAPDLSTYTNIGSAMRLLLVLVIVLGALISRERAVSLVLSGAASILSSPLAFDYRLVFLLPGLIMLMQQSSFVGIARKKVLVCFIGLTLSYHAIAVDQATGYSVGTLLTLPLLVACVLTCFVTIVSPTQRKRMERDQLDFTASLQL